MNAQYSILNPMTLLLKGQGYPPAVCFAVGVHAILLYFLLDKQLAPSDMVDLEQPSYISAATINENPQQTNRAEQERQQAQETAQREAEAEAARQREAEEQAAQEAAAREEAERQAAAEARQQEQELAEQQVRQEEEAKRQAEAERARQEQLAREQEAQLQAEREAEAARQAAAEQAAAEERAVAENAMTGNYEGIIHRTISNNWSIPPSARNGMSVLLNIRLVPTGEVVSVEVVESSGDAAFDRSAEQAVRKAARFPELQDMPINLFERQFRSLYLLFRPEDLLR